MLRGGAVLLTVREVARAVRFYVETLGMKLVDERSDGTAVLDAGDGFRIELHEAALGSPRPEVILYAKGPLEDAIAVFENRGVTFNTARTGHGAIARFCDPDGNPLALVEGSS